MVGHDDRGKDGEPIADVEAGVVAVGVDSGQLNLVPRLADVAQVPGQDGVLGPGQPPGLDTTRGLLDGDPLVVVVQSLLLVEVEGSQGLALGAGATSADERNGYPIPHFNVFYIFSDFGHSARQFMTGNMGEFNIGIVPHPTMPIASA